MHKIKQNNAVTLVDKKHREGVLSPVSWMRCCCTVIRRNPKNFDGRFSDDVNVRKMWLKEPRWVSVSLAQKIPTVRTP